ncbi:T9SS type A sorting domain-containing protein, partial [Bacteroidota bacterium]
NTVEISSITAYISNMGLDAESETYAVQYAIFKEDLEGDEDWIEVISSEYTELDPDGKYWLTLSLDKDGESEFLEPGDYIVATYLFGLGDEVDIRLGYDMTTYLPDGKSKRKWVGGDWGDNGKLKMIGINTTERGGPTIAPVTFNVDMNEEIAESLFNPASDFVDVTGTFNDWSGSEAFTDVDGDGIYTLTVPDLSTGETIEYKYRINANDLTSEADNRSYEVRYWNVLDNSYKFNAASVVDNHDIVEKLIVYPNPTNGMINIVVNNAKQSDLIIEMRDVQGQLIYSNSVIAVLNHREVIDINLAKGMYFLSVNDGSDIRVKKVIVQ